MEGPNRDTDKEFDALPRAIQGNFDHLMGMLKALGKNYNQLVRDFNTLQELTSEGVLDGEDGAPGAPGAPGADGADGTDGADGADGPPGGMGRPGLDGQDGDSESMWYPPPGALLGAANIWIAEQKIITPHVGLTVSKSDDGFGVHIADFNGAFGTTSFVDGFAGMNANGFFLTATSGYFSNLSASSWTHWDAGTPNSLLQAADPTHVPLQVAGAALQTADLQRWTGTGAALVARVDAVGNIYGHGGKKVLTEGSLGSIPFIIPEDVEYDYDWPTGGGGASGAGTPGATGATGPMGPAGPAVMGLEGPEGEEGAASFIPGPAGPAGAAGAPGAVSTVPGPQGPIGQAIFGEDGDDGWTIPGPAGAAGAAGSAGSAGATGPQGPIGFGLPGEDGDDGWPGPPAPIARTFAQTIGDGASTSFNVDHNLGTQDVFVDIFRISTGVEIEADITRSTVNRVVIGFVTTPSASEYRVLVR